MSRLPHLVTLLRDQRTRDGLGQEVRAGTQETRAWAHVRYLSGIEALKGDQVVAVTRASVRIRTRADIGPDVRLRIAGKEFEVRSALPADEPGYTFLACEEVSHG